MYTESYVSRHKGRIRGTFSAVTCPTPVGPILLQGNYNENLFHSKSKIIDLLIFYHCYEYVQVNLSH